MTWFAIAVFVSCCQIPAMVDPSGFSGIIIGDQWGCRAPRIAKIVNIRSIVVAVRTPGSGCERSIPAVVPITEKIIGFTQCHHVMFCVPMAVIT
jgi:hypothetical protein